VLEEMGPTGLVAAFGIEPTEDPARLAALAAMAIAKAAERARRDEPGGAAGARLALHVQPALVGGIGGTVVIDSASKATTSATLHDLLQRAAPEEILVSAAATPFLERRFELESAAAGPGTSRLTGGERVGLPVGGRTAPLVGRHHELELLRGLLEWRARGAGGSSAWSARPASASRGSSPSSAAASSARPCSAWRRTASRRAARSRTFPCAACCG
jgi:hypothetical protein